MKKRKIYNVTPEVYECYIKKVKWNLNTSLDQCRRKLSRNIQLAREYMPDKTTQTLTTKTYRYGNLHITTRFNTIIKIENHHEKFADYSVDRKRYIELSEEYGIII